MELPHGGLLRKTQAKRVNLERQDCFLKIVFRISGISAVSTILPQTLFRDCFPFSWSSLLAWESLSLLSSSETLCSPLFALLVGIFSCSVGFFQFEVVVQSNFSSENLSMVKNGTDGIKSGWRKVGRRERIWLKNS